VHGVHGAASRYRPSPDAFRCTLFGGAPPTSYSPAVSPAEPACCARRYPDREVHGSARRAVRRAVRSRSSSFLLRIVDVSLSTMRILLAVRGHKYVVPFIGFFEVLIWVFAVGNAIRFLDSPLAPARLRRRLRDGQHRRPAHRGTLAIGYATIRIVSRHAGVEMADALRSLGFGVTEFAGRAATAASRSSTRSASAATSPASSRGRALGPAGVHHRGGAAGHPLGLDALDAEPQSCDGPRRHARVHAPMRMGMRR
jgi:hypothetical protein